MTRILALLTCLAGAGCSDSGRPSEHYTFHLPVTIMACLTYNLKSGEHFAGWKIDQPFKLVIHPPRHRPYRLKSYISDSFFNGVCEFESAIEVL